MQTGFWFYEMMNDSLQQPSDTELRAALIFRLAQDERLAHTELRAGVLNGIVHLAGQVGSLSAWQYAADVAAGIPGVRGVVNRIEAPGAPSPTRIIHINPLEDAHDNDWLPE